MDKLKSSPPSALSELSVAGQKALRQLRKGCSYRVHGAWRFRGSRGPTSNATLVVLLEKGLAERVDIDRQIQVRITPAGSSFK